MKILHIISSLRTGGAERLMTDLLPRLQRDGVEVDILLFDGTDTPFKQKLRDIGINVYEFGKGGSVYNPIHIFRLIPYFKKYDIIHTHTTAPQFFAALTGLFFCVRLVTTEHSTNNRRRSMRWYRFLDKWMYRQYDRIICVSDKTEESIRQYLGAINRNCDYDICTVCNGIDTSVYAKAQPDKQIIATYGSCKRLFMISRFVPAKDQKTVIRAMMFLLSNYHVFFVGDGENRASCEALTCKSGLSERVHFLGTRTNVPELIKTADIVIQSSHWEGYSLAAVEGMAAHKPVVASDVAGLSDIVGGAGLLFEHGNAHDLANNIQRLMLNEELYCEIADRCLARAAEYDIAKMANEYETIYRGLLAKKHC